MKKTWTILLLVLLLPLIQSVFEIFPSAKLGGSFSEADNPVFSIKKWLKGEFQSGKEEYINENFGFRNLLVRYYNQLQFNLYKNPKVNKVVIGKENYLYEQIYIDAYNGTDFVGEQEALVKAEKLKFVQDTLAKMGKTLLIILAPGKADFFPEFIPDELKQASGNSNYKTFSKLLPKYGINLIDFNGWCLDNKSKSPYPLFPKYGIHWSMYTSVLAIDSILKKLEHITTEPMPHLVIDNIIYKDSINEVDYDIAASMNLLANLKSYKMAYPKFHFEKKNRSKRVVGIGDSFFWNLYNYGLLDRAFNNGKFWYYYKQEYPASFIENKLIDRKNIKSEILNNDIFIVVATTPHLTYLGFDFIEDAYDQFTNIYEKPENKSRIEALKLFIRDTPEWMKSIEEKAAQRNISVDSMITLDAIYTFEREKIQNLK